MSGRRHRRFEKNENWPKRFVKIRKSGSKKNDFLTNKWSKERFQKRQKSADKVLDAESETRINKRWRFRKTLTLFKFRSKIARASSTLIDRSVSLAPNSGTTIAEYQSRTMSAKGARMSRELAVKLIALSAAFLSPSKPNTLISFITFGGMNERQIWNRP